MILVILPESAAGLYTGVKRWGDITRGVITQCVVSLCIIGGNIPLSENRPENEWKVDEGYHEW